MKEGIEAALRERVDRRAGEQENEKSRKRTGNERE